MKLNKETLKQIIKEELEAVMEQMTKMPIIPIDIPIDMRHRMNKAMHGDDPKGHAFAKKKFKEYGFQNLADQFDKYLEDKK